MKKKGLTIILSVFVFEIQFYYKETKNDCRRTITAANY